MGKDGFGPNKGLSLSVYLYILFLRLRGERLLSCGCIRNNKTEKIVHECKSHNKNTTKGESMPEFIEIGEGTKLQVDRVVRIDLCVNEKYEDGTTLHVVRLTIDGLENKLNIAFETIDEANRLFDYF